MERIFAYIKFLLRSKNQHGVHSPFVYDLITKCFYDSKKYAPYFQLKKYRQFLLQNKNTISVTDLGANSRVMKDNTRVISQISKNAGTTYKRAKLLYRLTSYFKFNTVLELGTSLGMGTQAIHLGNSKAAITTIEGCPNTSKEAISSFKIFNINNINCITGDFNRVIKELTTNTYDFIFFDGNHQKEATLNYFETLLQTIHNDSVFIFDDIYWSKEMTEAWEEIKQHPKVSVTIDTFFWGFVFFRKEQEKEHFTIRI
ncbi:class I SAM-dependent methyltransferase [Flavobacteriaceae bacterium AU392]|nr:class I SAM-dependent methyltransferase [Flavobacteriaceae bacterium]RKM82806.1 class I SAM-dependent methyltransferase [Flavobacteriaceae bacterium AU392]